MVFDDKSLATGLLLLYMYVTGSAKTDHIVKKCTLEIQVFERGHVLDPNILYCTNVHLGPLATSW